MSTNDVPAWAAWRWLDNLLDGDERGMSRADLLTELRTIGEVARAEASTERDAYLRLTGAYKDLIKHVEAGDPEALARSLKVVEDLHEEAKEREGRQTEDKIPRHWNVSESRTRGRRP